MLSQSKLPASPAMQRSMKTDMSPSVQAPNKILFVIDDDATVSAPSASDAVASGSSKGISEKSSRRRALPKRVPGSGSVSSTTDKLTAIKKNLPTVPSSKLSATAGNAATPQRSNSNATRTKAKLPPAPSERGRKNQKKLPSAQLITHRIPSSKKVLPSPAPKTPARRKADKTNVLPTTPARTKSDKVTASTVTPAKIRQMPTPVKTPAKTPKRQVSRSMSVSDTPSKRLPKPQAKAITSLTDLSSEIWGRISTYLGPHDLAALSRQCKRLRGIVHKLALDQPNGPLVLPTSKIPLERVATITTAWPKIKFSFTCRQSASGTFWSAQTQQFENISMVPQLGTLHSLVLAECDDITELDGLENVEHIKINRCNSLRDLSPLSTVTTLSVEWCLNVSKIGVLRNIRELVIDRCPKISNLNGFAGGKIEILTIKKCRNIRDVDGLDGVPLKVLTLEQMHNITDLSPLYAVEKLIVSECPRIKDVEGVLNVPELVLIRCRSLAEPGQLACFPNVTVVENNGGQLNSSVFEDDNISMLDISVMSNDSGNPSPSRHPSRNPSTDSDEYGDTTTRDLSAAAIVRRLSSCGLSLADADADERAEFDASHQRARLLRRQASEQRKEQIASAEAEAKAASKAAAAVLLADLEQQRNAAERERDKRKDRVAAMLARARQSGSRGSLSGIPQAPRK